MKRIFQNLYLGNRLFIALGIVVAFYILAFLFSIFLWIGNIFLIIIFIAFISELLLLFNQKKGVDAQRFLPEKLSNGDENNVKINLKNNYPFRLNLKIIDEVPFQFQLRNFEVEKVLEKAQNEFFEYSLFPKNRGEYFFGSLNVYASSPLGFISRRYRFDQDQMIPSYPSFIHLPKYEIMAMQNEFLMGGIKKIRKIGHTMEFEQIKEYVMGDDIRSINWKASGKRNQLMVNQYQEEKSQRIYMIIDKGRTMKMPFNGLTLLDYSINASMAISHIVLKKKDHAGVMTFSNKTENIVAAEAKPGQLRKISENLYNVQTNFYESDFNKLYIDLKYQVNRRSLMILFTNFETLDGLYRQLKYLRAISKSHLLVVVFFKNPEIMKISDGRNHTSVEDVYDQIIAEKFEYEKRLIRQELLKYGIQSVYTLPENLSISVINKYLEIKARGIL